MKNFKVNIHYEGGWLFNIKAKDKDEAREKAIEMFSEISDSELIANLADVFADDCWEEN